MPTDTETRTPDVVIEMVKGVEGSCLSVDGYRLFGPEPWGGGSVMITWKIPLARFITEWQAVLDRLDVDA